MPANNTITVNLLQQEGSINSPFNRIMMWITTYGRYIMITTELIVLIAFASRFSLDRKLSDLKENIMEKQEILEANKELEQEIRDVQNKISLTKTFIQNQSQPVDTVVLMQMLMPQGTHLSNLVINEDKVTSNVIADTSDSFSKFMTNFSTTKTLAETEISKVEKGTEGIQFSLSAKLKRTPPAAK